MKRRVFISNVAAQALVLSTARSLWAVGENGKGENYELASVNKTAVTEIMGHPLKEMRDFHKRELFEEYIKLWDWRGIDQKYGGFLPYYDADGNYTTTDKEMYYQGRGLWVFSYIYNHFEKHERHLKRTEYGVYVPVNIEELFDTIRVAPKTEPWFVEVVQDILMRYNLEVRVMQSDLDEMPH